MEHGALGIGCSKEHDLEIGYSTEHGLGIGCSVELGIECSQKTHID